VLLRHVPLRVSDEATTVSRLPGSVCEPKQFVSCRLTLMDLPGGPERTSHGQFITLSIHCTGASQRTSHVYPPTCCRNLSVYEIITITMYTYTLPSIIPNLRDECLRRRPKRWDRDHCCDLETGGDRHFGLQIEVEIKHMASGPSRSVWTRDFDFSASHEP